MGKMLLVSVSINGKRYSAFLWSDDGQTVTMGQLLKAFPELGRIPHGNTYSVG